MIDHLTLQELLIAAWPSWQEWTQHGPLCFAFAILWMELCARIKSKFHWPTGYSRKAYHLLTFLSVAFIQLKGSFADLCMFGFCTSSMVGYALIRGSGHPWFEVMARPKDAPHQHRYIILPWLATFLGGWLSHLFFAPAAIYGYLVVGLCDAIAEPVGHKWGKHRLPTFELSWLRNSHRTWQGSSSIFIMACVIPPLVLAAGPYSTAWNMVLFMNIGVFALSITSIEAFSPHGWDNFTLQIMGSAAACYLFPIH